MIENVVTPPPTAPWPDPVTEWVPQEADQADTDQPTDGADHDHADAARVAIPEHLLDELRQVAAAERREVDQVVEEALDQYLADHWIRRED